MRYVQAVLRRGFTLFFCLLGAGWLAAGASPARRAHLTFALTLTGYQQTVVTRASQEVDELGCTVTRDDADRQRLSFATTQPASLAVSPSGRFGPTRFDVVVTASGSKHREREIAGPTPECDLEPQLTDSKCGPAALPGRAVVRSLGHGELSVTGSLERARDRSRCAPTVAKAYRFLVATEGRFQVRHLTDERIERIVLRGNTRLTDTLVTGARRATTVRWTMVLTRLA